MLLLTMTPMGLFTVLLFAVLFVIVFGVIFWAVKKLAAAFELGEPVTTVLIVVLVLVAVTALVYYLAGNLGMVH